ncbi:MAG TPA: hypothetical protein VM536_07680, partial [Chloroflexia bacterium]|nr:hypothetical protein [Chloroflexia bacterium]
MKRTRFVTFLTAALLLVLLSSIVGWLPSRRGAGGVAAQGVKSPAFLPVTLADLGPEGTNNPNVTWLGISGEWVAYTLSYVWCGHCQLYARTVYLHNTLTGQVRTVETSVAQPDTSSISAGGATEFRLVGGRLYWTQPVTPFDPIRYTYNYRLVPGSFTCEHCTYDPVTDQGRPAIDNPPADPPGPWTAGAEHATTTPYTTTLKITPRNGGTPLAVTLAANERLGLVATGGNRVAYVFTQPNPKPGAYLDLQFVKYAMLDTPNAAFMSVWARADADVAAGRVPRSWLWGPKPRFTGQEAYAEGVNGRREVLYYDKSRMEINDPIGNAGDPYYVTNGLLVTELISGDIQLGNSASIHASVPCTIPVAGDPRVANPVTPGYAALAGVASLHGDHQAPNRVGAPVDGALDVQGVVSTDRVHAGLARYAAFAPETRHNIPDVFWTNLGAMRDTSGF